MTCIIERGGESYALSAPNLFVYRFDALALRQCAGLPHRNKMILAFSSLPIQHDSTRMLKNLSFILVRERRVDRTSV